MTTNNWWLTQDESTQSNVQVGLYYLDSKTGLGFEADYCFSRTMNELVVVCLKPQGEADGHIHILRSSEPSVP